MNITTHREKWQDLTNLLKNKEKVALACSGGLDSRLLAYAISQADIDYKILHIEGCHIPKEEEDILASFSEVLNIKVERYSFDPLSLDIIKNNPVDRCYHCKKAIFSFLLEKSKGYILCDGTNIDDLSVYRPGLQALKELEIASPFVEVGITKADIRNLAQELNLPVANQASQACLLTRFDYNISPTKEKLLWLDEKERALKNILSTAFRLRCVASDVWQLHILEEKEINNKEELLEKIAKILPQTETSFVASLNGYFDKKNSLAK